MVREFCLMNGDSVPGEGLDEETLTVPAARAIVAQQLKLQVQQVVFFETTGLLTDGAGLPDGLIQVYIQELKISVEEFLAKARKKVTDCAELQRLTVLANLTALPEDVGQVFPKLSDLCLKNNHISRCPDSIGNLRKLKQFDFGGNQLTDLPDSIQQLTALRQLKLDRNQFQVIPEGILSLERLEELSMSSNQLCQLPESLGFLKGLQQLQLSKNQIRQVPVSLKELQNLTELSLSQNQLPTLPDVFNLPRLRQLDLSHNKLSALPESLIAATTLQELLVNHNRLSFLPSNIGNLTRLKDLNLSANVLQVLPESFQALEALQNVWLDKGQMMVLPASSRAMLRVAATLYTTLEGEALPPAAAAPAAAPARKAGEEANSERILSIFKSLDLNGDGVLEPEELRLVLRRVRDVGSALNDEMIDLVLQQMDTNQDGLVNFEEFLSWLYGHRPSTEKQLLRRAVGILEAEGAEAAGGAGGASTELLPRSPPSLTRLTSRALAEEAQAALAAVKEEELADLAESTDPKVKSLLEILSLLLAGMVPGESGESSTGPLVGAATLMQQPRYFLSSCGSVLSWIDEGKLPEENLEAARAVKNSLPWQLQPEVLPVSVAQTLCKWTVAIFAYFDAVENWEP